MRTFCIQLKIIMTSSKKFEFYFHSENENSKSLERLSFPLELENKINFFNVKNMDKQHLPSYVDGCPLLCDMNSHTLYKGASTIANFLEGLGGNRSLTSVSLRADKRQEESWFERYRHHPLREQDFQAEIHFSNSDSLYKRQNTKMSESEMKRQAAQLFNKQI